ncbi:MAG: DEAD/DEAH box helicase [Flavobacterium sp.]|uniref:DEAD/DEAH box helicase n=1 Tax=Flavobacterium sp. TaxID=239 RepID=UPI003BBF8B1C
MENTTIDVQHINNNSFFVISGSYVDIISNKRLLLTLKRLNYESVGDKIHIPFRVENQIHVLQEIQNLLNKYGFNSKLSSQTKKDVESFNRENEMFDLFSEKARSIRNDEFKKYPQLVEDYKAFKIVLNNSLARNLYPLQELSAFHMSFAQNSCNFAVPGAGKTSIVYGAYSFLKSLPNDDPRHIDKLLVIGPLSSFAPWTNEYFSCFGKTTSFQRLSGDINISKDKKLEHLYSGSPAEITLIFHGGVDSLQGDIIEFLKKNKTMVVVDEAHRIKNPEGIWGKSVVEISKEAKARVILTGTPVPNGYQDIYNLYKFIYPFKYKEILKFHYQNLEDLTYNSLTESSRVQELKQNLSPFFIRIKKDDLKLPPIEEKIIKVDMDSYQREIYDFIETTYINSFKHNESATIKDILNKAKLIRLRQASTNPSLLSKTLKDSLENNEITGEYDPNAKFTTYNDEFVNDSEFFNKICNYKNFEIPKKYTEIKKIIEHDVLPINGKVIIWTIFIQNAKELMNYLQRNNINSRLLIGEIEQSERENTIEKFNNPENEEFQVIIANPFSVAESISLHKGCHNAIYLERDYNCSNFLQSKDRIHRVGLEKNQITTYYYIISNDSIDEVINDRLNVKIERMEKIINDDIPLFNRINDDDETDIIKGLIENYAKRS